MPRQPGRRRRRRASRSYHTRGGACASRFGCGGSAGRGSDHEGACFGELVSHAPRHTLSSVHQTCKAGHPQQSPSKPSGWTGVLRSALLSSPSLLSLLLETSPGEAARAVGDGHLGRRRLCLCGIHSPGWVHVAAPTTQAQEVKCYRRLRRLQKIILLATARRFSWHVPGSSTAAVAATSRPPQRRPNTSTRVDPVLLLVSLFCC